MTLHFCEICGTTFVAPPSHKRKFCSRPCRDMRARERWEDVRSSPRFHRDGTVTLPGRGVIGRLQRAPDSNRVQFISGSTTSPFLRPLELREWLLNTERLL